MRIWAVPTHLLCRKHLQGEHVETHMFLGTIEKGNSLQGFIDDGLFSVGLLRKRHDDLAREMLKRGGKHDSPLDFRVKDHPEIPKGNKIDVSANILELARRCPGCYERVQNWGISLPFKSGGDRVFESIGEWRIQMTGRLMPTRFDTQKEAKKHLTRLRRNLTLIRQGRRAV
jgi:hypothetical protein